MTQHLEALERANEVRLARAGLKRDIKAGRVLLGEYLTEPNLPKWLEAMPIEELLGAVHRLRNAQIGEWMKAVPVKHGALVRDLTYRKRRILAAMVEDWERRSLARSERRARASIGNEGHPGNARNFSSGARSVA